MLVKILKKTAIVLLIALVGIQFYRPSKNKADYSVVSNFEKETKVTGEIRTILQQNCYDCHSDHTIYPWYAEIAPISFLINDHIVEGKEHFNVSEWQSYSLKKKDHKMEEVMEEVEEGHMPEDQYTWLHGTLSEKDTAALINWVKTYRSSL